MYYVVVSISFYFVILVEKTSSLMFKGFFQDPKYYLFSYWFLIGVLSKFFQLLKSECV